MDKSCDEMRIVKVRQPIVSIEVDIDSIPDDGPCFDRIMGQALWKFVDDKVVATVYVYRTQSTNFYNLTDSIFIGAVGCEGLLDGIYNSFKFTKGVKVQYSEYLSPSQIRPEYQLQDGYIWHEVDPVTWSMVEASDAEKDWDDKSTIESVVEFEFDNGGVSRNAIPSRYRSARSDASVGSIKAAIEEVFGLPEGSVALCCPDGKHIRSDASIATLRKRWE